MAEIELFLTKTVEQNAAVYYESAKRAKQKREGVLKAMEETHRKLDALMKEKGAALEKLAEEEVKSERQRKKEWYQKFHWFMSSEGFLCIGGRDSTTNEVLVKKHTDKDDLVLHTDMAGSPFFVVKDGQRATEQTVKEAAQATASYSKAWKLGVGTLDVFYVTPEQVSKKAKTGEYMPKGAFMIYGQTKYMHPLLEIALGVVHDGRVIGGAVDAVKAQAERYVILVPGKEKTSDVAKRIKHILGAGDVDEIISFVPAGGCAIKKR